MAAGMHLAGEDRGIVGAGGFLDRQRVHIGAQPGDGAVALPPDQRHNTRLRNPFMDFVDAELAQPFYDESRGFMAVEAQLGVHVPGDAATRSCRLHNRRSG